MGASILFNLELVAEKHLVVLELQDGVNSRQLYIAIFKASKGLEVRSD